MSISTPVASVSVRDQDEFAPFSMNDAIYAELKRLARHHLRTRAAGATISTTDLLHDAYLKFGEQPSKTWQDRAHFFGSASRAMRQVLVDYARHRHALKRGGGARVITLGDQDAALEVEVDDLLAIDAALVQLRLVDPRLCQLVELRFFAGLDEASIADVLRCSTRTVRRDWLKAKLLLARTLDRTG